MKVKRKRPTSSTFIDPAHLQDLTVKSGLNRATIELAGIYTETDDERLRSTLCVPPDAAFQPSAPALAFPYHSFDGFVRYRFYGKGSKYLSPYGQGNRPYLIPGDDYTDPSLDIFIVEGEKKALKLWQELRLDGWTQLVIGLSGVNNFGVPHTHMSELLPYLDALEWGNRNVYLGFDNDMHWNECTQLAHAKLADVLIRKGAIVKSIDIPIYDKNTKYGADDYIVKFGWPAYCNLIAEAKDTARQRFQCSYVTGPAIFKTEPIKYVIDEILHDAPLAIGGPKKSLKTHVALDIATSLASGRPCLDAFKTRKQMRVFYCYGESRSLQHILPAYESVLLGKGLIGQKNTLPIALSSFMPIIDEPASIQALQMELLDFGANVVIVDPLYRSFGKVEHADQIDMARNLLHFFDRMFDINVIPIVCHHFKKTVGVGDIPELDMFTYSGIAESIRSWLLLNHRSRFNPQMLIGDLWMVTGGSGYSTLKQLRINSTPLNYHVSVCNAESTIMEDKNSEYQKHKATVLEYLTAHAVDDFTFYHLRFNLLKRKVNPTVLTNILVDLKQEHYVDFISDNGTLDITKSTKGVTFRAKPTT